MSKVKVKSAEDIRKSCVNFSLSEREKRTIEAKADSMGISVSAYIRYKLLYGKNEEKETQND